MATFLPNGGYTSPGIPTLGGGFDLSGSGLGDATSLGSFANDAGAVGGDWLSSFLGGQGKVGWGMPAIAGAGSVVQGLLGMQQYGLAQDQFKESKRQYNQNYQAQKTTTNAALEDRQRARVASNPGAYQSVADYLDKNKVV